LNEQGCDDKKSKLNDYLQEKNEKVIDLDILIWWKTTGSKYEIISLMAWDVLSIPVTIISS